MMGGKGAYKGTGTDVSEGSQATLALQDALARAWPFDCQRQLEMADRQLETAGQIINNWTMAFQHKCLALDHADEQLRLEKENTALLKKQVRTLKEAEFLSHPSLTVNVFCWNLRMLDIQ